VVGDGTARYGRRKKRVQQPSLFAEIDQAEAEEGGWDEKKAPTLGKTALDRVHQAMLLFGTGRSAALKRFLTEGDVGKDARFWRLAQAFSALYPAGTDEKRWVDGVLARKKGLGL
jgi:putative DNA methylase